MLFCRLPLLYIRVNVQYSLQCMYGLLFSSWCVSHIIQTAITSDCAGSLFDSACSCAKDALWPLMFANDKFLEVAGVPRDDDLKQRPLARGSVGYLRVGVLFCSNVTNWSATGHPK